jgi:2-C-methyl-D-erythritol 2,4-cyclodiphosphate synthase
MRIGFGYDVHQLKEGFKLFVGGIEIPHTKGAVGHSDADVLIHAICDSMLGAAALGDIGKHFPDTSPEFKGIDSKILLRMVKDLIEMKGYRIGNIDSTLCLQRPKISPFIPEMVKTLASVLAIGEDRISVKATTTEKLGFVGREEGISAYAVVLLE